MVIVVLAAIGVTGLMPKALISTYLSFFPVAVGMVKGLRSPELMHLDLMHTYNASRAQTFWKLRVPASVPFLFTSMKVAIAASLVGAIVGELPTGAVAGIGAKLLNGILLQPTPSMSGRRWLQAQLSRCFWSGWSGCLAASSTGRWGRAPHERAAFLMAVHGRGGADHRGFVHVAGGHRAG
jgi:hypothetical protein